MVLFFLKKYKYFRKNLKLYDIIRKKMEMDKLIKELCTRLLDSKIAENENFIRFTFYELRVKNNLSEEDTNEFLRLCISFFDKKIEEWAEL